MAAGDHCADLRGLKTAIKWSSSRQSLMLNLVSIHVRKGLKAVVEVSLELDIGMLS